MVFKASNKINLQRKGKKNPPTQYWLVKCMKKAIDSTIPIIGCHFIGNSNISFRFFCFDKNTVDRLMHFRRRFYRLCTWSMHFRRSKWPEKKSDKMSVPRQKATQQTKKKLRATTRKVAIQFYVPLLNRRKFYIFKHKCRMQLLFHSCLFSFHSNSISLSFRWTPKHKIQTTNKERTEKMKSKMKKRRERKCTLVYCIFSVSFILFYFSKM